MPNLDNIPERRKILKQGFKNYIENGVPDGMIKIDTSLGIDGAYGLYKGYFCIFFSGSNEPIDYVISLLSKPNKLGIHQGYYQAFHRLSPTLWDYYNKYISCDLPILVAGFSSGGAIALICAMEFANAEKISLVTYGQTKAAIKSRYTSKRVIQDYVRVVHPWDILTRFPFNLEHLPSKIAQPFWLGNPHSLKQYLKHTTSD